MEGFVCFDDMIVYQNEPQYSSNRYKILVIGRKGSGRSALVRRFKCNVFQDANCDNDLFETTVLVRAVRGDVVKADIQIAELSTFLQNGDSSSPARVHNAKNYLDVNGVLLLYDMTDSQTFEEIIEALPALQKMVAPDVDIFLVGTKSDLIDARAVTYEDAENKAQQHGYSLFETSAVTGMNCEELLIEVLDKLSERRAEVQEYYMEKNEKKMMQDAEQVTTAQEVEPVKPSIFCWLPAFWKRKI